MEHPRTALSPEQAREYDTEGVTHLPDAVPAADVAAMLDVLWTRLRARCGAHRDRPETWRVERPAQLTSRVDDFAAMASPAVRAALDQLLGVGGWKTPVRWGVPLVTFPGSSRRWDVPHRHWHLDLQATPEPPRVARLFLVLSRSEPGGGGTGYVAGSHRVIRDLARREGRALRSAEARKLLIAREPWFAALATLRPGEDRTARFMAEPGDACGVPVQVREMLGEPGDVLLMDPHMLHSLTPNVRKTPRMMLTEWVYGVD
jgi:hypothetical protein